MQDTCTEQILRTIAAELDGLQTSPKGISAAQLLAPIRKEFLEATARTSWREAVVVLNQWLGEIFPHGPGKEGSASITIRAVRVAMKPLVKKPRRENKSAEAGKDQTPAVAATPPTENSSELQKIGVPSVTDQHS